MGNRYLETFVRGNIPMQSLLKTFCKRNGQIINWHCNPILRLLLVALSGLKQNGGSEDFCLPCSKSSLLVFHRLSNEQNVFINIF